ncbi:MAG: MmcQ/YjbR family DNA-binding protein [Gemmatimonadetes bacterium]|nr:MmcQ/YjbR family DNA-binding protein [Gemmatimonadota bacterium]
MPADHFAVVRALAAVLPGVEEAMSYGTPALKVKGKLLARLREDGETLVVRTTPEDRELMLRTWPKLFHLTEHYRDYPFVLVRLDKIDRKQLAEVLEDAWVRVAPLRLRKEREARGKQPGA